MTSPNCRLFLVAPGSGDAGVLAECLSAALAAGDIASILVTQSSDTGPLQQIAKRLLPIAQSGDAAVLIEHDVGLAKQLRADGIEVAADLHTYKAARASLGTDMVIGANCASDRHRAMELAEAGADYVRLAPFAPGPGDEPVISWWSQLFQIPSVTSDPLLGEDMTRAAHLGADFVRPDDAMWSSPAEATKVIASSMQAIAAARR